MSNFSTSLKASTGGSSGGGGDTSNVVLFEQYLFPLSEVGQTDFVIPAGYIDGRYFITRNGSFLIGPTLSSEPDYEASTGVTITLTQPIESLDEEIILHKFSQFLVVDAYSSAQTDILLSLVNAEIANTNASIVTINGDITSLESAIESLILDIAASNARITQLEKYPQILPAIATTSGTSLSQLDLPSGLTKFRVVFSEISNSGTGTILLQLGTAGGLATSAYRGNTYSILATAAAATTLSTAFQITRVSIAATFYSGSMLFTKIPGTNDWIGEGSVSDQATGSHTCVGKISLSGELDRLTLSSANSFDFGSFYVELLEGV